MLAIKTEIYITYVLQAPKTHHCYTHCICVVVTNKHQTIDVVHKHVSTMKCRLCPVRGEYSKQYVTVQRKDGLSHLHSLSIDKHLLNFALFYFCGAVDVTRLVLWVSAFI